ncbi:heme lyase CcmF/NrfE family subunit [Porticoccus sp. W117]|nr:heme lyase CcmF/NrfE family subunit [Porticoccus sp. W117]MDM3869778.1 heme lyase CcmF/NrfE family subunit [Porticoccus sp. W117]
MIPELGQFSMILALCLALVLAVIPMWGAANGNQRWMGMARSLAAGQFVLVALAFYCLVKSFLDSDFSVAYVAANSNTQLPDHYKVTAVWGAHEGSFLLWELVQAGWTLAVALLSRNLPQALSARVLAVMGAISACFLLYLIIASNPFERILPAFPAEGRDLNPLLQDFGMIVHPPVLYMGYVGFSVAFAFAMAALIGGRLDTAWTRWVRPWTSTAWAFLTMGIALGSWWAYYELGWGGWWFWDPVENASFMPWLAGAGLVHSLAVAEKRGMFRTWTLLLAILTFSLSLLGTFLVRSGIINSVHAFAVDSARGVFILSILGVVIGGSLLLFALRSGVVRKVSQFEPLSRETFLLLNNILLMLGLGVVFVGTLYPLYYEWVEGGRLSIGPPWFNLLFNPVFALLVVLIPVGALLNWKRHRVANLLAAIRWPILLALLAGALLPLLLPHYSLIAAGAIAIGAWVFAVTWQDLWRKSQHKTSLWQGMRRLKGSYYGMVLAHVGIVVALLGVALTSVYEERKDVKMAPGETVTLAGYEFRFDRIEQYRGPNYEAYRAHFFASQGGGKAVSVAPEKRYYPVREQPMTEAGIDAGFWRDLMVTLSRPMEGQAWAVSVQVKPFVRWIWLGAILVALGSLLAALDKRYRRYVEKRQTADGAALNAS